MCFWKRCCFQTVFGYLVSFTVLSLSLTLLLMKPAVSEPRGRPSAIVLKLEALSGSVSGPVCQIPPEPSFVFCLMPGRGERASFAFRVHLPAAVAGKRFVSTPWAEMRIEGANSAFSCSCEWGRPAESGRRELLKRERVLNRCFAGMLPLGRNVCSVQYGAGARLWYGRTKSLIFRARSDGCSICVALQYFNNSKFSTSFKAS